MQKPSSDLTRLVHVDGSGPGIRRKRAGEGWRYERPDGTELADPGERARIDALAVPPAWRDVWIAPDRSAHLQATGIDGAGRKQYRYHPAFREEREHAKFDDMLAFGAAMPTLRARVAALLDPDRGLGRERVLAAALRLLDVGLFRIGSEHSVAQYHHYGLTTLLREHVRVDGGRLRFDYVAKAGVRRRVEVVDAAAASVIGSLRHRRGGPEQLLAHRDPRRGWMPVRSEEVNDFLRAQADAPFSAKEYRTWNATVLAAATLAQPGARTGPPERAERIATTAVAQALGNTPAVARASYIDPRVFARFRLGRVIALPDLEQASDASARRERTERAVLDLLREER